MRQTTNTSAGLSFFLLGLLLVGGASSADQSDTHKTVGGIDIYIGVMPAEVIRGRESATESHMHGGVPIHSTLYHLMGALFEPGSGARITGAEVRAIVAEPGMAGQSKLLQPMTISDAVTYGNYFAMSDQRTNRIHLEIQVPGKARVAADLEYSARGR